MSRKLKHKYVAAKTTNNIEIDNLMEFPPEDPSSVDGYNSRHRIEVPLAEAGGTYNPLYTCRANALCYIHLMHRV